MSHLNKLNEKIWSFFTSVDLAVALFIFISISAAIGTVIPQQPDPEVLVRFLSKFFSLTTSMRIYEIVYLLDLNNVYRSWWFTFLLFMFGLNLIVCSIDRLPKALKAIKNPPQPVSLQILQKMPFKKELKLSGNQRDLLSKIINSLKRKGFAISTFEISECLQINCKKWTKTRLAVYLTHLSILIILSGAVLGAFSGFRGSMNILEGTASNMAISDEGKEVLLPFKIMCERFEVEFYENSDTPKAFRSYIRVFENNVPIKINGKDRFIVEVNAPFSYKGITFYQATYGFEPSAHAEFRFTYFDKNDKEHQINAHFKERFKIPGTSAVGSVIDFSPALGIDEQGRLFNMSSEMINPAVLVEFHQNGKKSTKWILTKVPETWDTHYGKLKFNELWGAQFTGLQVKKDPGVLLIYIGSILMCIGIFITLFLRPITYYIVVTNDKINFYCPSSKGIIKENEIDRIIKDIQKEVK